MILIITNNIDDNSRLLKAKWPGNEAVLLSVNDLTQEGWKINNADFTTSTFIAEGKPYHVSQIKGVINLLSSIYPYELFKIVEADRIYVSAELNAFLFYFLSQLSCKFLNDPSLLNLAGPHLHTAELVNHCNRCGIATVESWHKMKANEENDTYFSVSYLDGKIINTNDEAHKEKFSLLAKSIGLNYFTARLSSKSNPYLLQSFTVYPDCHDEELIYSIHAYFNSN